MKILVTGARGQVGTELVLLAEQKGHHCMAFDETSLDITDEQQTLKIIGDQSPQVVINAAAYTAVDRAETESDMAYRVNEAGVRHLAMACRQYAVPLLHISTDYVFDGNKKGDYLEADQPNPTSVYGASKLAGENALAELHAEHLILRVSWVFGAHGHNFVKTMLKLAESRDELGVVNDQYGAPTSAVAIARSLLTICEQDQFGKADFPWGLYHLTSNPGVSWYDFAQEIFHQAGETGLLTKKIKVKPIGSEQFPTPVKRPVNSKLASGKSALLPEPLICEWQEDLRKMLEGLYINK